MEFIGGIDVGSRVTKAVVMDNKGNILGRGTKATGAYLSQAAETALNKACQPKNIKFNELGYIASTGYGRYQVPFRHIQITDITSNAYGALYLYPKTRCIIDIGAMNARAMKINEEGRVMKFRMNDKCASGAGRFLERVALALELELDEIGSISLGSKDPQLISNICAVLAESEVINLVTKGVDVEDIVHGAHKSISDRVVALLRQVGIEHEITLTGGVTKNVGMIKALEEKLECNLNVSADSEFAGAIGAALLGIMRLEKKNLAA